MTVQLQGNSFQVKIQPAVKFKNILSHGSTVQEHYFQHESVVMIVICKVQEHPINSCMFNKETSR